MTVRNVIKSPKATYFDTDFNKINEQEIDSLFHSTTPTNDETVGDKDLSDKKIKHFTDTLFLSEKFNQRKLFKTIRKLHEKKLICRIYEPICEHTCEELFFRTLQNSDLFLNIIKSAPLKNFKREHEIFINQIKQSVSAQHWNTFNTGILQPLGNKGITTEKVRIEIAKIAAAQNGESISQHIRKYGITDQEALIEIARIAAAKDGWGTSHYIQNYGIISEAARIEIAKVAAFRNSWTPPYIQNYGITSEAARVEIAKIAAAQNGVGTSLYIQKYDISDQKALIEIAKVAAANDGGGTSRYIQNYGITDQKALIEIAMIADAKDGWGTSLYIQNYGIISEAARVEIAKISAAQNGWRTSQYIQKYGITDKEALIEIAKIAAEQDGGKTSEEIRNYGITDEEALIEIAKIAAAQNALGTSEYIRNYGITSEATRIDIAKIAAKNNGGGTSRYIQNYNITSEATRIDIAKVAAEQDGGGSSDYIENYGITNEAARIEIAKISAEQDGWGTSQEILNYGITDQEALIEIAKIAAAQIIFRDLSVTKLIKKLKALFRQPDLTERLIEGSPFSDFKEYLDKNRSHRPCCEWGYRMMNALPDGLSEANLQQRIRYITAVVLSMEGNRVSHQEIINLSNQEALHQALLELKDPKMQKNLFQCLADLPKQGAVELFCTWINSEKLSENPRKVKSIQILAVLILAGRCEQDTILTLLRKINRNFIRFQNRNLLLHTLDLIVKSPLSCALSDLILKGLFSFKDSKSIMHAFNVMKGIFSFGEASDLTAVSNLNFNNKEGALEEMRSLFSKAFIEAVHLENKKIENFSEKYEKTFGKFRDPEAIKKYAATLNQLPSQERQPVLSLLGEYVVCVLDGSFKEWRYENSSHLNALWADNKKLQSDWKNLHKQEPLEKFLKSGNVEERVHKIPNFQELILLAFDQNHISKDEYPLIYNYLLHKDQRTQIMDDLISVMKSKKVGGPPEEKNQLQEKKNRVKFQKLVIQLVEIQKNPVSMKYILNVLQKIEAYKELPIDFENDVRGWRNGLENSLKEKNPNQYLGWTCGFSDDANDLLLCGTDVDGSCQRIDGTPNLNKCLLAYMCDGKNQLVVIKDCRGKIQARAVLRLLEGKDGEPVLFLERIYPAILAEELEEALVQTAAETAKGLGLALLSIQINPKYMKEAYPGDIRSNGSIAHFEYEDASKGIFAGGKFTIAGSHYVDLFVYS